VGGGEFATITRSLCVSFLCCEKFTHIFRFFYTKNEAF
jgi:hypothetical protein